MHQFTRMPSAILTNKRKKSHERSTNLQLLNHCRVSSLSDTSIANASEEVKPGEA